MDTAETSETLRHVLFLKSNCTRCNNPKCHFCCKETTFLELIQLSESLFKLYNPPNKTAAALTCPSHIDSPPEGPNQFLLFWVALPAWTCSGHQRHSSIRPGWLWLIYPPNNQFVSLSLLLLLLVSRFLFSLSPLRRLPAVVTMCGIWWKSESADGSDTAARESNNAIPFWPWRTANSHVHQSIFLTRNLSFLRKPTDPSCKQRAIILCYFRPVDLWQLGMFLLWKLMWSKAEALHSLSCNWTWFPSRSAASSRPLQRDDVRIREKLFNPSCNCSEQAAGLFVSAKQSPFVTSREQQEVFCSVVQRKCRY